MIGQTNMNSTVTNFAVKWLRMKMYTRFLGRVCILIFCAQLLVIFTYNNWFNPVWDGTKKLLVDGLGYTWDMLKHMELKAAWNQFSNGVKGFCALQYFVWSRSLWTWLLLPGTMLYMAMFDGEDEHEREYADGSRYYIPPFELNKAAHSFGKRILRYRGCIQFGQIYLPYPEEIKNIFAVGKPGSGKTNTFNQVMEKLRKLNRKAIIHDYKGDYVEKFFDPERDMLFNPLDARSLGWCLFNDCETVMDLEAFGAALIPDVISGEPFWNNAARDIFVGVLRYCYVNNIRTNKAIWETVTLRNAQLYGIFRATPGCEVAAKYLEDPDGKTATSIMSNLMQFVKIFDYMQNMAGDFSIRRWVEDKSANSMIFITNYARLKNTLRPMISLFVQTVANTLLSMTDDLDRRLYFFLDEFGKLPNMSVIEDMMTAARSKGGSVLIGIQDIGQMDKIYKADSRKSILNSASTRLIFNCKDGDTAKFFSNDIGYMEYYEKTESHSLGVGKGDRLNTNRQKKRELIVTPEDIQSLQDLHAFISIGPYNVSLSRWKYWKLENKAQAFVQRLDLNLEMLVDVEPVELPTLVEAKSGFALTDKTKPESNESKDPEGNTITGNLAPSGVVAGD